MCGQGIFTRQAHLLPLKEHPENRIPMETRAWLFPSILANWLELP